MTLTELDQVVFCIYPDFEAVSNEFSKQTKLTEKDFVLMQLEKYYQAVQDILRSENYRWHDCGLQWKVVDGVRSPFQSFLSAHVVFGDSMEDEWFCVKLLLQLTASFPSLVASIFDSDGEFMLIEAAEVLPRWLEPETAKNRVFIAEGKVQLVSPNICPSTPDLQTALKLVRAGGCEAADAIQKIILSRASQPQMLHKARLRLPEKILKLLGKDGGALLGPALSAFYNRSPEGMRICTEMPCFNPTDEPQYESTLSLTRIQFAQLLCQEFTAPANDKVNFALEQCADPVAAELGMKLTCGFEMLMQPGRKTYLERSPFSEPITIQQRITELLDSAVSCELIINDEPADGLEWMRVDEAALQEQLNKAFANASLNPDEEDELLESWTAEYEGTRATVDGMKREVAELDGIVEKMKTLLQSASNYEGIDCEDSDDSEDSESFSEDSEDDSVSDDDEFIEREIFEAINFDPDLLMKIIEVNAHMGADSSDFLQKFQEFQAKNPVEGTNKSAAKQKGLADIDPAKVAEARKSARQERVNGQPLTETERSARVPETHEAVVDYSVDEDDDEDDDELDEKAQDELIYGKPVAESKREALQEVSDCDDSDFESYTRAMDAELREALQAADHFDLDDAQLKAALASGLLQAADASRGQTSSGPVETVLASLKEQLPVPFRK